MSRPEFFTLLNEARRNVILKLGQFSFSQQYLVIPVAGIPLTVVRTYNSLNLRRGDFGYGWTYAINETLRSSWTRKRCGERNSTQHRVRPR